MTGQKIFFVGKAEASDQEQRFITMGRELGRMAADRGATLIVGSDRSSTLDRAVVDGASEVGRTSGRPVNWEIVEPSDRRRRFAEVPLGMSTPVRHRPEKRGEHRWEYAHLQGVLRADAVVAMGGSSNTRRACRAAIERGVPTWPIPHFGGGALDAFLQLIRPQTENAAGHDRRVDEVALRATLTADLADIPRLLLDAITRSLTSQLQGHRHVYFISYSREDIKPADDVELFLRQQDRGVMRDETHFSVGKRLKDEIREVIAAADDVIVIDSEVAGNSKWVDEEIRIAQELQWAQGGNIDRIVGVLLEGYPPRTGIMADDIHVLGKDRDARKAAVMAIVKGESQRA